MQVKDIMTQPVITVSSQAPLESAIDMLLEHKVSGLPVVNAMGQLCGILSEGDLLRRTELGTVSEPKHWWSPLFSSTGGAEAYRMTHGRKVFDVMTPDPVSIDAESSLAAAAELMEKKRIKRLPVLRDGVLVGIVSRANFVRALGMALKAANEGRVISDTEIRDQIQAEIDRQDWALSCSLRVDVIEGRVTLSGNVSNDSQRRAACVVAENAFGVRGVTDEITILEPIAYMGL